MADKPKSKVEKDEPEDVIDRGKAQGGRTATGQEAAVRSGVEGKRIDAQESRGGPEPEEKIEPDFLKPAKNIGLQSEPAEFVVNGSIPPNSVASNSGLVPVSAIAATAEEGETKLAEHKANVTAEQRSSSDGRVLSDELIEKMSGAEIRAVAHDRGYVMSGSAGTRGSRASFKEAQKNDVRFGGKVPPAAPGSPTPSVPR